LLRATLVYATQRFRCRKTSEQFKGADIDGWYALNLSEDIATGLGSWSIEDIAGYLKTGVLEGKTTSVGPITEVVHNSLRYLTPADLQAIGTYLTSIPPDSPLRTGRRTLDPTRAVGARLYIEHCMCCHQAKGKGIPGGFPSLIGNGTVVAADPADMLNVMLRGIPIARGSMPSFAGILNNEQIASIANYLRTSWGNTANPNATAAMGSFRSAGRSPIKKRNLFGAFNKDSAERSNRPLDCPRTRYGPLNCTVLVGSGSSAIDMQAAEEPKNEKNDQYQAQSAADPRPTVPTVPVIATAAAEQQDDQDNDQDCAHSPPSLPTPDRALDR
jgi:mono/diheme cytochrome c family protein